MKKLILNLILSFLISFIPLLVIIFLFSYLASNEIIKDNISEIVIYVTSTLSFFIFSFILSLKQKNHGFIRGIVLSIIYILLCLIIKRNFEIKDYIFMIVKSITLILGSILGIMFLKESNV